ncbi:TPA: peptide-methionine (S)-S-oxide reductase MsrA [Legionella pneumophila]|nr:peptide-methionine (S)-S-oxide reductase MsrA [Legionella pneumophila]
MILLPYITYAAKTKQETAIFAGGCFWSMQHDFEKLPGVISTTVGYTGGNVANPSYEQVSTGMTGHYEAIQIVYDPSKTEYAKLLDFYWHDTDPTNAAGQFCDSGNEYHPVIFYLNNSQKTIAENSKNVLAKSGKVDHIVTQIAPAKPFYPAEDYHQHYSDKNPENYNAYRAGCRRDAILKTIWGN